MQKGNTIARRSEALAGGAGGRWAAPGTPTGSLTGPAGPPGISRLGTHLFTRARRGRPRASLRFRAYRRKPRAWVTHRAEGVTGRAGSAQARPPDGATRLAPWTS